jgi:transcriptional regulator of acetoin/glycerol metabolism
VQPDKQPLTLESVQRALDECDGDVSKAAELLGYARSVVYDWMRAHHIKVRKVLERTA